MATGGCSRDRTQAPSGVGYALENRIDRLARLAGRIPRQQGAAARARSSSQRKARPALAGAVDRSRRTSCCSRRGRYRRRISSTPISRVISVIRSSKAAISRCATGAFSSKTLEGLQPRGRDLRRVDDTFCDPLELRARFLPRRARSGRSGARRHTWRSRMRWAPARSRRPRCSPFLPGARAASARRRAAHPERGHVVVRPDRANATTRSGNLERARDQARVRRRRTASRSSARRSTARELDELAARIARESARLRRPGTRAALHRAGLERRAARTAPARPALLHLRARRMVTRSCPAG